MSRVCPSCGAGEQPAAARFCFACGGGLDAAACASCRADLVPGARFCGVCGADQRPAGQAPAGQPAVASRRITSVLFGDLVGFTSLSEARDQEDVRELLTRYFDQCRQVITRYGGTVEKFIGDAVMAVWGVPTAHEDDAERAVRAGLELVNAIEAMGADLGIPELAMRVGIVTGEVAVTVGAEGQGMVAGDAVNTASRVQSAATPGQVWVDETTRLLTTSAISYVDVGSHALKGKVDPVPLWGVRAVVAGVGGSQREDGLEAPLVGRDRELRLVKEIFHGVEESRRPTLLVVDGEPGVGKSRLGWEFEKYVDGLRNPVRWHFGRCLAYGEGVAYYALAEAVRARLRAAQAHPEPGEDEEDEAALLELGLERYVPDAEERAWLGPRLGALLGIGGVGSFSREDLFSAWTTFLDRVAEDGRPVVLAIDDAQHADDSLLLFLEYLLGVGRFPCLVLLFTRPGLLEANPTLATNRRATVVHLEVLSDVDMARLVDGLVVGLPDGVRAALVDRSEGVPLYAVETVRSLIDRDLVVPRGGQYVLDDPDALDLGAIAAPASLQSLIAARLDALDGDQRRVVDLASVIGDAFTREQIGNLCPEVADVDGALAGLVRLQLLRQESSRFTTALGHYEFVQSAVRQVAYGTLSRHDRKAGHLAVVELLESGEPTSGEAAPIVAQHLLEALDAVPDAPDTEQLTRRAVTALREAAARASALGAPSEAAGHLAAALSRSTDPALAAAVERDLAQELHRAGDLAAAVRHAEHATARFDELGDVAGAGDATALWATSLTGLGHYEEARTLAEERYAVVRELGHLPRVELALSRALVSCYLRGGTGNLLDMAAEHLRLAEYLGDRIAIADGYGGLSVYFQRSGTPGLGRLLLGASADLARAVHDNRSLARALLNLNADLTQDDATRAADYGREAVAATWALGDRSWVSVAVINLMLALAMSGEWDEALQGADDDSVLDLERPFLALVRQHIRRARGEQTQLGPEVLPTPDEQDEAVKSVRSLLGAMDRADAGDVPGASDLAVSAVRQMLEFGGLYDDFTSVFVLATDLLWELGATAAVADLVRLVDGRSRERLPTGLRSQLHRMRGLLLASDETDPAGAEAELRDALALAREWHSGPATARALADLARCLEGQGRTAEAAELAAEARRAFEHLGARRWLAELDARAGVAR